MGFEELRICLLVRGIIGEEKKVALTAPDGSEWYVHLDPEDLEMVFTFELDDEMATAIIATAPRGLGELIYSLRR